MLFRFLQFFNLKKFNLNFFFKAFFCFSFIFNYSSIIWLLKDPVEIIKFFIKFSYNNIIESSSDKVLALNDIFDKDFIAPSVDELSSIEDKNKNYFYLKILGGFVCIVLVGFLYYNFSNGSNSNTFPTETLYNSNSITDSSSIKAATSALTETASNTHSITASNTETVSKVINNGYNYDKLAREFNAFLSSEIKHSADFTFMGRIPAIMEESSKFINSGEWTDMPKSKVKAMILYIMHFSGRN